MSELAILDKSGDVKVAWDTGNAEEVAFARRAFVEQRKKGFAAFRVSGANWRKGEAITEFDPEAERIIMTPPIVGG